MKLTALIDNDFKCLESYIHKLFDVLNEAIAEDRIIPKEGGDIEADESQASYYSFAHLVKPGMLMNIYSLVDFRLQQTCEYHRKKNNLSINYEEIKGRNELNRYQRYLTRYAGLDPNTVHNSYKHLDNLRKVRNQFIHSGGHIRDARDEKKFSDIGGIKFYSSLIVIEDSFIWDSLDHAKKYLFAVAQANEQHKSK